MKPFVPIIIVGILLMSGLVTATTPIDNLIIKNQPPGQPTIIGEIEGKVGVSYTYTFNAEDPDGDNVSYYVDWGDGTDSGWTNYYGSGVDIEISHSWNKIDRYPILCHAKDIYGVEGEWNDYPIYVSKQRTFDLRFILLNWLFEQHPLLQQLLGWLM